MQITENLIYLISVAVSIGGSYLLLNYKSSLHEKQLEAVFRKINSLNDDNIISKNKVKLLEEVIKHVETNNIITKSEVETGYISRLEYDLQKTKINDEFSRLNEQLSRLTDKIEKIYDLILDTQLSKKEQV